MTLRAEVTDTPNADDLAYVGSQLSAFNDGDVGPSDMRDLTVFLRDDQGAIQGGCSGWTGWGWLYVRWMWVAPNWRGQGHADSLLKQAEQEAVARGCHSAHIDTFSPPALRLYERLGYEAFGRLPDFPVGRTRTFLKKRLTAAPLNPDDGGNSQNGG